MALLIKAGIRSKIGLAGFCDYCRCGANTIITQVVHLLSFFFLRNLDLHEGKPNKKKRKQCQESTCICVCVARKMAGYKFALVLFLPVALLLLLLGQ